MGKKYYIIYETKNLKNGKTYIGMHETNNIEDGYLGSGKLLKRAIRYYGKEFFERRVLHIFDNKEDMVNKEIELVTEDFVNREDTYNLNPGGEGGCTEEHKQKWIKSGLKGIETFKRKMANDPEYRKSFCEKVSANNKKNHLNGILKHPSFKNKKHSEATIKKMKESRQGKQAGHNNSQYGTCWIHNPITKENKKIYKGDNFEEPWVLGRKMK